MFSKYKKIITKIALFAMIFSILPQNFVKVHADPAPINESLSPKVATVSYPYGIAVDSSNNIYVAGDNYFSKISPDGSKNDYTTVTKGYGVAIDNSGNLYVTEGLGGSTVKKMSSDGTILNTYTGFNSPYGVAVDNSGNLYVANMYDSTIQKVSSTGEILKTYSNLNLNHPYGIALDSSNNIYVADYTNCKVKKVSAEDGTIMHTYDGFLAPSGVAIDSDNNIYVVEKDGRCVKKLSQDGTVLAAYNGFSSPRGIALDKDKNIYVSDWIGNCIKKIVQTQGVEITGFDAIGNVSAGNAGSATYSDAASVIAALPTTVKANGSVVTVPVSTWVDTDSYNPNAAGSYTFTATLGTIPTGYKNTGNNTATVEVTVAEPAELTRVAIPIANPAAGTVTSGTTVSLSTATDGAAIYYTLDLSDPTTASTLYTGPITINGPTTIKAIAVKDGMLNSEVLIANYHTSNPPSGSSFSVQFTGKPVETVSNLVITPNITGGYHFSLPNETKNALLSDVNSVNTDKVNVTISKGIKSISGEFPKTNITNENLTTGLILPVTITSPINIGGNDIASGRYNVSIKMTPGSTESDFDLTFAPIVTHTLTYTPGAGGTLAGTSTQTVDQGASGTAITAVANSGYHFVNWSDNVTTATRTDSNIKANIAVTANFEIDAPPTETTTGTVVDPTTGKTVQGVETKVTTETDGTKTVAVKSQQAIVLKAPDGKINPLTNISQLGFSSGENSNVTIASDGTIKIEKLSKGTEEKINVTIDLGNGQKVIIGNIDVKVSKDGDVSLTSSLIDPYGIITDSTTGKAISGANVTLYYANTDRNKAAGKTPDTAVKLPEIADFKPNSNKNPQISDDKGAYGFMVFPTSDYYIVATKSGYNKYTSSTIPVEQEIVKHDFTMNQTTSSSEGSSGGSGGATPAPAKTTVERIAGQNRVDTAIAIAKAIYKDKVAKVILAASDNFPDALAGSVLAYNSKAPILLVGSSSEEQQKVVDYMKTNMDSTGTVYILGGTGGVSKDMETKVVSNGFKNITRIDGADRYETAAKIADADEVKQGTPVVIVSGENYADAVTVSSIAAIKQYPILMVRKNEIPEAVSKEISKIKPDKIYIIGLQGAVSTETENQVTKIAAIDKANIVRIGGVNRFETSLNVAKYFSSSADKVCVASGNNFSDALAGSSYASENNAPIMLVGNSLTDDEKTYLQNLKLKGVTIFGGTGVVTTEEQDEISKLINK